MGFGGDRRRHGADDDAGRMRRFRFEQEDDLARRRLANCHDIRGTGVNWAHGVARYGSFVGPWLGAYLLRNEWPLQDIFLIFAVPLLLAGGCILVLGGIVRQRAPVAGSLAAKEPAAA